MFAIALLVAFCYGALSVCAGIRGDWTTLAIGLVGVFAWSAFSWGTRRTDSTLTSIPVAPPSTQRARDLLLENLSPAQQATYSEVRWFETWGSDGRLYRIVFARYTNVYERRSEGNWIPWCGVPILRVNGKVKLLPLEDQFLAQKLLIETDAEAFKKIALNGPGVLEPLG